MITTTSETSQSSMLRDKLDILQPCFLFDSELFVKNISEFSKGFKEYFGDRFILSYSTKTNPHPMILRKLCTIPDAMVEIVSPHELSLAARAGFEDNRVVYNGVIPDMYGKFFVARNGGIVNVENYDELKTLSDKAKESGAYIEVGLRVNIKIDQNRKWESRFGIKPYTEQFQKCLDCQHEYFKIVGIHSHIHGCRTLDLWRERARQLGTLGKLMNVKYIDFGSNLFGYMDDRLASQFDCKIPSASDYAKTIHHELQAIYGDQELPVVIIEPGTPVVANTVSVLGKVETISDRGFDTIATASCSVYDFGFFHGSDKHPPMDVVHMSEGKHYDNLEIFGYACTEDDTVCKSYTGNLAAGDFLLFRNLGAYANSLCSNFIKPKLQMYDINLLNK